MDYGLGFDVEQDYFAWLCDIVHAERHGRTYGILMKQMHRIPFYAMVPHDENRGADGESLRLEYLASINYPKYISIDGECSMLELTVALARRMDYETIDPYDIYPPERTSHWFWEMMRNLRLEELDDEHYYELGGDARVAHALDMVLSRRYSWDGDGGLFPLIQSNVDQRDVELWYQMSSYLIEREAV